MSKMDVSVIKTHHFINGTNNRKGRKKKTELRKSKQKCNFSATNYVCKHKIKTIADYAEEYKLHFTTRTFSEKPGGQLVQVLICRFCHHSVMHTAIKRHLSTKKHKYLYSSYSTSTIDSDRFVEPNVSVVNLSKKVLDELFNGKEQEQQNNPLSSNNAQISNNTEIEIFTHARIQNGGIGISFGKTTTSSLSPPSSFIPIQTNPHDFSKRTQSIPQEQVYKVEWTGWKSNMNTMFSNHLLNKNLQNFYDVKLLCEGRIIKCNAAFLCANSTVFEQLLMENSNSEPIIQLKGISFSHIEAIVEFIYNGETTVYQNTFSSFLNTVKYLQIKGFLNIHERSQDTNFVCSTAAECNNNTNTM